MRVCFYFSKERHKRVHKQRKANAYSRYINLKLVFGCFITGIAVMDSTLIIFLALLFTFGIPCVLAFLIYYFERVRKPLELAKMGKYDEYTESKKTIKERVIVKEVVMLLCQYCGSLMPQTSIFCPHCGARRKS